MYSDDNIERRIAGAKQEIVPDAQHRDALRKRVLVEYDRSRSAVTPTDLILFPQVFWRWVMARPIPRLGIPAVVATVFAASLFAFLPARSGFALEEVIRPLLSAKSGRCQIVVQMKDQNLPPFAITAMFRGSVDRQESKDMQTVMISDESKGVVLSLHLKEKRAFVLERINQTPQESASGGFLQKLREQLLGLKDEEGVQRISLGERDMADKKLVGYRIVSTAGRTDIWGDQSSGLPHTVVTKMAAFPGTEMTMTNFEFDIDMDDSLFSLTPPPGYVVTRNTMDMSLRSEEGFVAAMKQIAEIENGSYPESIDMMVGIKVAAKYAAQLADKPKSEREKDVNRVRTLLAAGMSFPLQLPVEADATYAGKGVKRGDVDKPIFWYKPKEGDRYRVVYANLTVVDAADPPTSEGAQVFAPTAE